MGLNSIFKAGVTDNIWIGIFKARIQSIECSYDGGISSKIQLWVAKHATCNTLAVVSEHYS